MEVWVHFTLPEMIRDWEKDHDSGSINSIQTQPALLCHTVFLPDCHYDNWLFCQTFLNWLNVTIIKAKEREKQMVDLYNVIMKLNKQCGFSETCCPNTSPASFTLDKLIHFSCSCSSLSRVCFPGKGNKSSVSRAISLPAGFGLPSSPARLHDHSAHYRHRPGRQPQAIPHKQTAGYAAARSLKCWHSRVLLSSMFQFFSPSTPPCSQSGVRGVQNKLATSSNLIAASAIMAQTYYICCNFEKLWQKGLKQGLG